MVVLIHDIFEGETPNALVSHIFYGVDQAEAEAVCAAHAGVDEFLRASLAEPGEDGVTWGNFNGVRIRGVGRVLDAEDAAPGVLAGVAASG